MYGLINKALRDMITERFGEEQWQRVMAESGVPDDSFLTQRSYDDQLTYDLATAASKVLEAPLDSCLELFGEYWVHETATRSYGLLMDATGQNLVEFLENLNSLHDRITSTFLNYMPPVFRVTQLQGDRYEVHYISEREGLTPFVVGLLKGLATRFNTGIKFLGQRDQPVASGTHTVFDIEISAP